MVTVLFWKDITCHSSNILCTQLSIHSVTSSLPSRIYLYFNKTQKFKVILRLTYPYTEIITLKIFKLYGGPCMTNKWSWILNNNRGSKINNIKIITFLFKEEKKYTRKYTWSDFWMEKKDFEKLNQDLYLIPNSEFLY